MLAEPLFAHPPERRGVPGMGERDSTHGENRKADDKEADNQQHGFSCQAGVRSDFPSILMVYTATVCAVVDSRRPLTSQELSCLVTPDSWRQAGHERAHVRCASVRTSMEQQSTLRSIGRFSVHL